MNKLRLSKWHFRISTAFLVLGLFCWLLTYWPSAWLPEQALVFIRFLRNHPLAEIIFWEYAPVWPLIGAVSAFAMLVERRKQRHILLQLVLEIMVGFAMAISFLNA